MSDITIDQLFYNADKPLLSFEFFPPKDKKGMERLIENAKSLQAAQPDFVTVTYGAGGSTRQRTFEVCDVLQDMGYSPIMPHLTCVGSSQTELAALCDEIHQRGFRNIMTLRGDPPAGCDRFTVSPDGLAHASDLVALIRDHHPEICCGVAGYPERHPESTSMDLDIIHLKTKLAAGASFVTTQLFFDNVVYFDFVQACRARGIHQPVLPGILPAVSLKQIRRMMKMCNSRLPPQLEVNLEDVADNKEHMEAVGIQWASRQIEELLARGVPGIHLYILNQARIGLAPVLARAYSRWR